MTQKNGTSAWQNRIGELGPPVRIFFWQNRIEFWQKKIVGPPLKKCPRNAYARSFYINQINTRSDHVATTPMTNIRGMKTVTNSS